MARILLSWILILAACSSALADQNDPVAEMLPWAHLSFTVLGMAAAMRLALQAFGRRAVQLADVPTFPKYMTSQGQYRLASLTFATFASGFFLLLVYEHKQVAAVASLFGEGLPKKIVDALENQSTPYLVIIAAMGVVYLFLLTKEAQWNVLLMVRDVIQSWISVPQLASEVVAQIKYSLAIPEHVIVEVVRSSTSLCENDFRKDRNTIDRAWAEICYMKWWLAKGQIAGSDATFFAEESFGFEKLLDQSNQYALMISELKAHGTSHPGISFVDLIEKVKELHRRFSRLVACYLIYRNASREGLYAEAKMFGIAVNAVLPDNPLRYSIVYVLTLVASVYIGVYASAIAYDWIAGKGLVVAQDSDRVLAWIAYSIANFGLAIVTVLLLRFVMQFMGSSTRRSHLITYCWTFAVAFVTGPFGLAVAVHFCGPEDLRSIPFLSIVGSMFKWGLGPALVAVYISYYLDRQTCADLPDIVHSYSTAAWRLLNCISFAAFTVFVLLPPLMSLTARPPFVWDSDKLRMVALGTTFMVAFGLSLAAQFALRKGRQCNGSVLSPQLTA
jgi:hypothetical protein